MNVDIFREEVSDNGKATIGRMYIDGNYECWTLEDISRPVKIKKETCIPAGSYDLTIDYSPKYRRRMPHVLNVPYFEGIRIHSGNHDLHTEGCILLGRTHTRGQDWIGESKLAVEAFFPKLDAALERGEPCRITIHDIPAPGQVEGVDI